MPDVERCPDCGRPRYGETSPAEVDYQDPAWCWHTGPSPVGDEGVNELACARVAVERMRPVVEAARALRTVDPEDMHAVVGVSLRFNRAVDEFDGKAVEP